MEKIKVGIQKIKDKVEEVRQSIRDKYIHNRKKCKGTIISILLLRLAAGLLVSSFKSVDSISQGVPLILHKV